MLFLILLLLLILIFDTFTDFLRPAKSLLGEAGKPFYWLTNLPARMAEWGDGALDSRAELQTRIEEMETELQINRGRLLRMADLAAENVRLRQLLNATDLLRDSVLVTELIGVSPDPSRHEIMINRGRKDNVFEGQAVLDANGLMGQVITVYDSFSQVLLITDSNHALPVQVLRNGVRSIAEGVGDFNRLGLRYVTPTMDIKVGDEVVSSGLGGRFPIGYPVGKVSRIEQIEGRPYLDVEVQPAAWLDRSRHLLLIFSAVDRLESSSSTINNNQQVDTQKEPAAGNSEDNGAD